MLLAFFVQCLTRLLTWLEPFYLRWTRLPQSSVTLCSALDLSRSKSDLVLENALLRQQLVILQRQVKKPHLTRRDRVSLLLLASRLLFWKQSLLILKPETLLHWHRQGFRLFWRLKSRTRTGRPPISKELVTLIQQMATENPLWDTLCQVPLMPKRRVAVTVPKCPLRTVATIPPAENQTGLGFQSSL
jgi:putative transposase